MKIKNFLRKHIDAYQLTIAYIGVIVLIIKLIWEMY